MPEMMITVRLSKNEGNNGDDDDDDSDEGW